MNARAAAAPGFWTTLFLLLGVARKRATGRVARQSKLLRGRGGSATAAMPIIGFAFAALLSAALNLGAAFDLMIAVSEGTRVQVAKDITYTVTDDFSRRITDMEKSARLKPTLRNHISIVEEDDIQAEAKAFAKSDGGDANVIATRLHAAIRENPDRILIAKSVLDGRPAAPRLPDMMALIFVLVWCAMLVCQGEGPELDTQRPRHPMWEWLFSHPAPPGAIFLAEMLAPIAANPVYLTAPLFPALLYGWTYGLGGGIAAALLVGVPAALAMACLGKAIEIHVVLRASPRARGAILGLMGWFGYASLFLFLFLASSIQRLAPAVASALEPLAGWPWPPVRALVGLTANGRQSFVYGVALCAAIAAVVIAGSIAFSLWSARRGLAGQFSQGAAVPRASRDGRSRFGSDPLYRKELLWFRRDGGALVQVVLVPLSLAAFQLFNLRGILAEAGGAWNYLAGAAILFGTYFLLILGPKSLASEGQALWIALTWPRGLENLLMAKARLWALVATGIVGVILAYAAFRFPADDWKIATVGIGWYLFARSLAEKTVTLATVTSPSGEPEKIPTGLRWAASIGMLTFAIGVLTQQWNVAIAGIVYSTLTAAAMWQNFRFHLPFLYDPWSETLPPAPTLMHAMIGISAMVEGAAVLTGLAVWGLGKDALAPTTALIYGLCAIVASVSLARFLDGRGVPQRAIWLWGEGPRPWPQLDFAGKRDVIVLIAIGAGLGLALGLAAHAYLWLLQFVPQLGDIIAQGQKQMDAVPNARVSYAVMAVLFAPFAEEYLFRGLLFRALDREWGGWRAVLGSAAFFAIYHPALSWLPVAALGAANALLFKRTGRLAPAVALHMIYNATVLL